MKITDLMSYSKITNTIVIALLVSLFIFGNLSIFILTYIFFAIFMMLRTLMGGFRKREKMALCIAYAILLAFQLIFCSTVVFYSHSSTTLFYSAKLIATGLLLLPLVVERFITANKYREFYLPSIEEASVMTFEELKNNADKIVETLDNIDKIVNNVSSGNLGTILEDLPRHSATQYINDGSLTDNYFDLAYSTLDDPHVYIVISNTGSAASELLSIFTKKQYNHASLSFDEELKSIVSYNGGLSVYPPGLNPEMIEAFHQKEDASVLVYRLKATREQKQTIIDQISTMNKEGSAYNMIGLVTKNSYRPNIMFCSQFVYKMLELVGLQYFDKKAGDVRPTDFAELDYYKKLEFVCEIKF